MTHFRPMTVFLLLFCTSFIAQAMPGFIGETLSKFDRSNGKDKGCEEVPCNSLKLYCGKSAGSASLLAAKDGERLFPDRVSAYLATSAMATCSKSDQEKFKMSVLGKELEKIETFAKQERNIDVDFDRIKKTILKKLQDMNSTSPNPNFKVLEERLSLLKLIRLSEDECEVSQDPYFDAETFSIPYCPGFTHWPEGVFNFVLAHEVAHSIDPCWVGADLIQTRGGYKLDETFSKKNKSLAIAGLLPTEYPLLPVINCLQMSDSIKSNIETSAKSKDPKFMYCNSIHNHDKQIEIGEHFSDFMAAEVIRAFEADGSGKLETDSIISMVSENCPGKIDHLVETIGVGLSKSCQGDLEKEKQKLTAYLEKDKKLGEHGMMSRRLDRIFFAHESLANKAGCKKDPTLKRCGN